MPNTYFKFKQFRIEQDRCSMKVTTEGCLLGALVSMNGGEKSILDIGTGTGLLALMIAQRSHARIDAVELSHDAADQAKENFKQNPWHERMHVWLTSIQDFVANSHHQYDLIVSNPPFYKGHLKSGKAKDQAIHRDLLSLEDLAQSVVGLLQKSGCFWVIYPDYEFEQFVKVAETYGLILQITYIIYDRPGKPIFRKIGVFRFDLQPNPVSEVLFIKEADGRYSERFQQLVEPYYL